MANIVGSYLRDVFAIDARIKWPNDILVGRRKIAGILIEAKLQQDLAYLLIGIGINVEPVEDQNRPNAIAIREAHPRNFHGITDAIERFIAHVDARLGMGLDRTRIIDEWRRFAIHQTGDPIEFDIGDRTVRGAWAGIDEHGRAVLRQGEETITVSAGDLILP
jgi:BirA family biotin operon repressor/biotin-[acetyl-CoA-carboxylase] ligase